MSEPCHVDIETYSEVNLKKTGTHRYAEDESTEILCLCFAFGDGPVSTWVPHDVLPTELLVAMYAYHEEHGGEFIMSSTQAPFELVCHAEEGGEFRAHNAEFERTLLNSHAGQHIHFPWTSVGQWVCTAAKAAAHSLPRALEKICIEIDAPHKKNMDGHNMMMAVTKPRKPSKHNPDTRWTPWNSPDRFAEVYPYCCDDVRCERGIDQMIPDLTAHEQSVYCHDQIINMRGVMIDLDGVRNAMEIRDQYKAKLRQECFDLIDCSPTQTAVVTEWIRSPEGGGYPIPNLQKETIEECLKDSNVTGVVRRVLNIRRWHEMKAVSKFDSMMRSVMINEKLHGMFMYHGAGTGRWAGKIVQLQNLFRTVIPDPELALQICEQLDIDWLMTLYEENPMRVLASLVRSLLIASPGKDLLCVDFASIEARVTAWLADELHKLEIFRTHGMAYEYTGARIYGLPFDDLDFLKTMKVEYPSERFAGKTSELAFGFQGGAAAAMKMARKEGIEMDHGEADTLKFEWRNEHPNIERMWYNLDTYAKAAVRYPGRVFKVNKIRFKLDGDYLYMALPSNRRLAYYQPEISESGDLTYMGIDTFTRQWKRVHTYGGRLTENAVQATARDLLVSGMENLENAGYPIIAHVHDEAISEMDEGVGSVSDACELMCDTPGWAKDLPVSASGFRAKRYRKD